jgi:phenylacetic acid degradation operon negative regulatory protein
MAQRRNAIAGEATDGAAPVADPLGGRALSARSVVASTLLGMIPPRLSSQLLVRSGELFGIAEGTTRVALSRMVAAGELTVDDGHYVLAGHLLARQERQLASRSVRDDADEWAGDWDLQVVTGARRDARDRGRLREAMRQLKLAEVREGVWTRPANLPADRSPDAAVVVGAQCAGFRARPDRDDPAAFAAELWDLDGWAATARELRSTMAGDVERLEAGDTDALAPTFVVSAAVLRHLVADPQLPAALCPASWPGTDLRADYDRYDRAFKQVWRDWFGRQA